MEKKVPPVLVEKTRKRAQIGLFPIGNTPLLGANEYKIGLFGPIWVDKYPERTPVYGKKSRGVPLLLGVFCPFFGKILVQNAFFVGTEGPNFMRKD
jgi:hypothetical protein